MRDQLALKDNKKKPPEQITSLELGGSVRIRLAEDDILLEITKDKIRISGEFGIFFRSVSVSRSTLSADKE